MSATEVRVVLITGPATEQAAALARALVDEGLAACVNLVPGVRSVFRWEGETREAEEILLVAKTVAASVSALERRVVELHPYDVPEVVALAVSEGHAPYLAWVGRESVR